MAKNKTPAAVSAYMAKLAKKANKAMRGTPAARRRARAGARARWKDD